MNSQQLELSVWRTLRALIVIVAIVALLFICVFIGTVMDRQLTALSANPGQPPMTNPPLRGSGGDNGVLVQTYAEIVSGSAQRTANAWANGATMQSESIANTTELHAESQAAWPGGPLGAVELGNGGSPLGAGAPPGATVAPVAPRPEAGARGARAQPSATPSLGLAGTPSFYVTQPLANLRNGPSTEHTIVGTAGAGHRFVITGQSAATFGGVWWQVDSGHALVWIHNALGTTIGDTQTIPIVNSPAALTGGVAGELGGAINPTVVVAAPTIALNVAPTIAPPLQNFPYMVETSTRHAETNTVVFYAYVHEIGRAIDGNYLWITHNGTTYRSGPSSPLIAGTTKPSAPNDPTNVAYNVKIDFPRFLHPALDMSGEWSIVLVDGNNQALSPVTIISITGGPLGQDTQREIYLRYRLVNP